MKNNLPQPKRVSTSARPGGTGPSAVRFQSALYAYQSGDYSLALPEFGRLAERALARNEVETFLECTVFQIRLLAEKEAFSEVAPLEARVRAVVGLASAGSAGAISPKLKSRLMYVLGICCVYKGESHEDAIDLFRESIQHAIESGDRAALAWPLYGAATVLYARERHGDALNELEKLRTLLSCHPIPELSSSAALLTALILRNTGRLSEALKYSWQAFESLKVHPHFILYLHTLATIGTIHTRLGETVQARVYLDLADRCLKRAEFPRVARIVDDALVALRAVEPKPFDLRFFEETGTLLEAKKGEIRFDGQHILRDLLKVLLKSKGATVRKEDLVRQVWSENYSPDTHDNKIYVNIKRLRRLIESEDGSTEYILRGKSGYYINPKTRVEVIEP